MWAAYFGDIGILQRLLRSSALNVHMENKDKQTALHCAAFGGHVDIVRALLDCEGIQVNKQDIVRALLRTESFMPFQGGLSPIIHAAMRGHTEVVGALLQNSKKQVRVNLVDKRGCTALIWAAEGNHHKTVKVLIDCKDTNVNARNKNGSSALSLASQNGHEETVQLLLTRQDIDVNLRTRVGYTPLMFASGFVGLKAVSDTQRLSVVTLLLGDSRTNITIRASAPEQPSLRQSSQPALTPRSPTKPQDAYSLAIAQGMRLVCGAFEFHCRFQAEKGNTEIVKYFVEHPTQGILINSVDAEEWTLLIIAAMHNKLETVDYLLSVPGVDVNAKDRDGDSALVIAIRNRSREVVRRLLKHPEIEIDEDASALAHSMNQLDILTMIEKVKLRPQREAEFAVFFMGRKSSAIVSRLPSDLFGLIYQHLVADCRI
eukprot:c33247_g1_i1.p1 GENE.c33247_g1_i1~~c33247_g1_i1.p1  ORF type:complete len:430 (+),score=73.16 c33247_g1_i1:221-1510(+)